MFMYLRIQPYFNFQIWTLDEDEVYSIVNIPSLDDFYGVI